METPVHIEFQGMEPQEKLHAAIARHVAELEETLRPNGPPFRRGG